MYHFTYQNSPQVYIKCNVRIRMHEEIIIEMEKHIINKFQKFKFIKIKVV